MFLIIRTLELSAFTFANTGILNFAFSIQCNSVFYLFQTLDFPLWVNFFQTLEINGFLFPNIAGNSGFWLLTKIEIQCSAFRKHCTSVFSLIQTLEFWILAFSTLEFSVLAFPNIGIVNFGFYKHWNSGFWRFQNWIQCFGFSKHRMSVKKCKLLNVWLTNNTSGLENNIANILQLFK